MRKTTLGLLLTGTIGAALFLSARPILGDQPAEVAPAIRTQTDPTVAAEAVTAAATPEVVPALDAVCVAPSVSFGGKTIAQWRAQGPEGLTELMEAMRPTIEQYRTEFFGANLRNDPQLAVRIAAVEADIRLLDQVAQQRDAYAAGLYWYTDLGQAKAEAQRTGKPILSLRMLGRLCDEYSCANSRFFRTVLYADESIGQMLHEKFVLHWQSVRPVPVITIDMGDGRQIKRTITGNSAHYVLDPTGRVVDCLPGLYGADAFERLATEAGNLAREAGAYDDAQFTEAVKAWHTRELIELDRLWAELVSAGGDSAAARPETIGMPVSVLNGADAGLPDAREAGVIAAGKGKIELRMVDNVLEQRGELRGLVDPDLLADSVDVPVFKLDKTVAPPDAERAGRLAGGKFFVEQPLVVSVLNGRPLPRAVEDDAAMWEQVAAHYAEDARLDAGSVTLMRKKTIPAEEAFQRALAKTRVEDPMLRMVRGFEGAIALDTARNEHLLHRDLHTWFIAADAPLDLDALNSRVYAELFLTPEEDPWLGLVPADAYSALDHGGLSK